MREFFERLDALPPNLGLVSTIMLLLALLVTLEMILNAVGNWMVAREVRFLRYAVEEANRELTALEEPPTLTIVKDRPHEKPTLN
jgi:hypothetical protein